MVTTCHCNKIFRYLSAAIITLTLLLFNLWTSGHAQTQSRIINFQGKLTDQQGEPLDSTYTVIFSIYATATGGTALWTERHEGLSVSNGLVNTLLGSIIDLDGPPKVEFNEPRYLGITIDVDNNENSPDPEMLPRQKIIPAIYAYDADTLDGKDSSFFTNPDSDAGRQGVVQDLYEGDTKLSDKYIAKDATYINADTVDGYHAGTSGSNGTIPVINSSITYSNLRAGYASVAGSASSASSCNSCSSASSCSDCTNATNCTNCSNASTVNGLQFSPYRFCTGTGLSGQSEYATLPWPSNWTESACKNFWCSVGAWTGWQYGNISSNGTYEILRNESCY